MGFDVRNLKSEFSRRYVALGQARAIVRLLAARGLTVSGEQRERILTCTDLDVLHGWLAVLNPTLRS